MQSYNYLWPALIFISCFHFGKRDYFHEGLKSFHSGKLESAEKQFLTSISKGDSVAQARYYLYEIYTLEGREQDAKNQFLSLINAGIVTPKIVNFLCDYYRARGEYRNLYAVLRIGAYKIDTLGNQIVNRDRLATLLAGLLARKKNIKSPIRWVISKGFLMPMPDGNFYPEDTVRVGNLAIVLAPYLPDIETSYPDSPFSYSIAKLDALGLSNLIADPESPIKLKNTIKILDKVKDYLR